MNSATIVFQGLCLWLTGAPHGLTAVIPDFHHATPAHHAVLTVPKKDIRRDDGCPPLFDEQREDCVFILHDSGAAGGVQIDVAGDIRERLDPSGLAGIPRIQHERPLRMRREYAPDDGSRLAAQIVVTRGTINWQEEGCGKSPCPRHVRWTVTAETGDVMLVLSNLVDDRPVVVPLVPGAKVTIRNQAAEAKQSADFAHWCLYFTMFDEAGCRPPVPQVSPRTANRTAPPHAHGDPYKIDTIACSNSQYP